MMEYIVNDVRKKLGELIINLFTEDFSEKFTAVQSFIGQDDLKCAIVMQQHEKLTDKYVVDISNNLSSKTNLSKLTNRVEKEIVFTLFMRYHTLTMYLCSIDQNDIIELPRDNQLFFKELLTSFWVKGL